MQGNVNNDRGNIAATDGDATILASGDISSKGGRFGSTDGDLVLDASGQLTLTGSSLSAKDGTAALYGAEGVSITATKKDVTTTQTTGQFETREHAAVSGGWDGTAQAAYTEVIGGKVTTTNSTQTEWSGGTVDANRIDIRSNKAGVTIGAGALTAKNGITIQAEKEVNLQAQKGIDKQSSSTDTASLQRMGGWDNDTLQLVTTTTQGDTTRQETLRASSLNAGAGALTIASNSANIVGQSAQLAGDTVSVKAIAGNIDLESLQTKGSVVSGSQSRTTQSLTTDKGTITAQNGVTLIAAGDVTLGAQDVNSGKGALGVGAGGNVNLTANADVKQTDQTSQTSSSSWFGLTSSSTTTHSQTSSTTPTITTLKGQSVTVIAGDTLVSLGATLDGKDSVYAEGQKDQKFYAVQSENKTTTDSKTSDSFLGFGYQDKSSTDSSLKSTALSTTLISDKKVTFGLGQKADLQGATVTAPRLPSLAPTRMEMHPS